MAKTILSVKKNNTTGDIAHEYSPLQIKHNIDGSISDFTTSEIDSSLEHPVDIQCQPSYDGSVNLIINDDINPPRIINSRFSVLEDNKYKIISRNQLEQTNLYREGEIDEQTRLFRTVNGVPKIDFYNYNYYGQLLSGNYTFYIKLADSDYNQTDIILESGIIPIFKGNPIEPSTVSGGLVDELTDKAITLKLRNLDTSFSYVYVYYRRNTSDLNGIILNKTYKLEVPYKLTSSTLDININGFETAIEINEEELNIEYLTCTAAKTQTQVQNMLFFGNVQQTLENNSELQNLSYFIQTSIEQADESIGYLNEEYKKQSTDDMLQTEYYNPLNCYYSLGYWPEEIYRLGVVYIFNDDSLSSVYNLRGCDFDSLGKYNFEFKSGHSTSSYNYLYVNEDKDFNYLPKELFIGDGFLNNTKGVFKLPTYEKCNIKDDVNKTIRPIGFKFTISDEVKTHLKTHKIKGLFFVRQQRIPTTLAQGVSVGIDPNSYIPMLYEEDDHYTYESFLDSSKKLSNSYVNHKRTTNLSQSSGLLCADASMVPQLQSAFDNSKFYLQLTDRYITKATEKNNRHYTLNSDSTLIQNKYTVPNTNLLYVPSNVSLKYVNDYGFSTKAGIAEDASQFEFVKSENFDSDNVDLVRGVFCPFIGTQSKLVDSSIYSIKINNYSTVYLEQYFKIRGDDNSPFMSISNRYSLNNDNDLIQHENNNIKYTEFPIQFRGDCYTNTISIKLHSNFIDPDVPVSEYIIDPATWENNYKGFTETNEEGWTEINRADLNTVAIGTWLTYKCFSNYNLGLRSENTQFPEETALMGNPRSFYPLIGLGTSSSNKVEESWILNQGYSTTLGFKKHFIAPDVPYTKDIFDTRIMFSNVQSADSFRNMYRIFQGLSYKDIERQYGSIVKLLPFGVNLFGVFEHGCALIPINEKALISTNTGQSIHMYGAGVLQNQVSPISPDFGSIWKDSIIRTPYGIYGVDTYAKKIWRYNQKSGFTLISDLKIQRFLNDNIELGELEKTPIVGYRNVKTHYNQYKGDVMFTFYNNSKTWSLCFNELLDKWITKYSWTPLCSENINNIYYSLDQERAKLLSIIWKNQNNTKGLNIKDSIWKNINSNYLGTVTYPGFALDYKYKLEITELHTSYLQNGEEIFDTFTNYIDNRIFDNNGNALAESVLNDSTSNIILYKDTLTKYYYVKLKVKITPHLDNLDGNPFYDEIVILKNKLELPEKEQENYDKLLKNGFYVHGRAGIFDELDYFDLSQTNNITPTKWYNKQEPFEFEFVVNQPSGLHKIFNNLVIISNNVEPNSFEFILMGDVYDFPKEQLFKWQLNSNYVKPKEYFKDVIFGEDKIQKSKIIWDHVLNQYNIKTIQPSLNMENPLYKRRLGNIQYIEDSWKLVIPPIYYTNENEEFKSTRMRDKYVKIKVKYSGENLAVITAIQTLLTISYA